MNLSRIIARRQFLQHIHISYSLEDALACYERAVAIDRNFAEGDEEIGHIYDAVMPNPSRARRAFRKAAGIRKGQSL